MQPQKGREGLNREALFSLQETWERTHYAQHQEVQVLQQRWKPQEVRRDAQIQLACKWKGWDELCPASLYRNQKGSMLCT